MILVENIFEEEVIYTKCAICPVLFHRPLIPLLKIIIIAFILYLSPVTAKIRYLAAIYLAGPNFEIFTLALFVALNS